jgi:adenine-specific DNA-methyltransferase
MKRTQTPQAKKPKSKTKAKPAKRARKKGPPPMKAPAIVQPDTLDLRSEDIAACRAAELLRLFPEIRTEGRKLDFDRLKLALGESVDVGRERYGLNWPGRADCFKTIQAPSLGTLLPCPEESVNFDATENLIIEGDNLEVLKLLQKSYLGKVKIIYIDPPYNTGNDFIYPDNYTESLQTYLEYTGQADTEGKKFGTNTEADGRFHSKWLNMMYPRLYLAKNLLRDDGILFVSIDDSEVENLRRICNDVFGEENFVCQVCIVSNPRGRQSELIATTHEYLIAFSRNADACDLRGQPLDETQLAEYKHTTADGLRYRTRGLRHRGNASRRVDRPNMFFPLYVNPNSRAVSLKRSREFSLEVLPRKSTGEDGRWEWGPETVASRLDRLEGVLVSGRGEWDVYLREFLHDSHGNSRNVKWKSVWDETEINYQNGKSELKELFGESPIEYPKPTYLLTKIVEGTTRDDDLVLDFFAGSGTTAQAVLELNERDGSERNFILVQLPEPTGRTDFRTIADICKERVRRVITSLNIDDASKLDMNGGVQRGRGFRVFKLAESNFTTWDAKVPHEEGELLAQLEEHVDHIREDRSANDILYELLLKSGFPLTTPIEKYSIAGKTVCSVAGGALIICLERKLTLQLIRDIAALKPERVVLLDEGFAGNDQLKANAVQTFKTNGVTSFRTV